MNKYGVSSKGQIITYSNIENDKCDCIKCGGTGYLETYSMVENGICFKCDGIGRQQLPQTTYTLEVAELKAKNIIDKANSKYAEQIAKMDAEDKKKSIYGTDTYAVLENINKDEAKAQGGKWDYTLQTWTFKEEPTNYKFIKITYEDTIDRLELFPNDEKLSGIYRDSYNVDKLIAIRDIINNNKNTGKWIGQEKEKIQLNVTLDKITGYSTDFGYTNIYIFKDTEGNKLTWKTAKDMEWEEGQEIEIKATVKAHEEYNNEKQTSILRVKEV